MYYAYVIQNPKGILYKGSTPDIEDRVKQHNSGEYKSYTKSRGPWQLVHLETFKTKSEALVRERFLESGKGRKFLKQKLATHTSRGGAIGSSQGS